MTWLNQLHFRILRKNCKRLAASSDERDMAKKSTFVIWFGNEICVLNRSPFLMQAVAKRKLKSLRSKVLNQNQEEEKYD